MVSLREKAVKRILLSIAHVFVLQGQLTVYRKRAETLRTERIFARKFAGKFAKSELSLENSGRIIGRSKLPLEKSLQPKQ